MAPTGKVGLRIAEPTTEAHREAEFRDPEQRVCCAGGLFGLEASSAPVRPANPHTSSQNVAPCQVLPLGTRVQIAA